jgi:hypothetical protein
MTLAPRLRRAVITASIATAAVLLPAVALASSAGTATAANTAAVHRCYQSQLVAWLGIPAGAAAGHYYYELELSNKSGQTCTLYGYPGVSALTAGHQDGSAAGRTASHPKTLVTLPPGATAHAILEITNAYAFPPAACKPVTATQVRVYPPGAYASLQFGYSFAACSQAGPVYLHVSPMIRGTGIPGYSI